MSTQDDRASCTECAGEGGCWAHPYDLGGPWVPQAGSRVRVRIADRDEYAVGAAEALDGAVGTVTEINPRGMWIPRAPWLGVGYLVTFDEPRPTWWAYQMPTAAFWFSPDDLEAAP